VLQSRPIFDALSAGLSLSNPEIVVGVCVDTDIGLQLRLDICRGGALNSCRTHDGRRGRYAGFSRHLDGEGRDLARVVTDRGGISERDVDRWRTWETWETWPKTDRTLRAGAELSKYMSVEPLTQ
jgi:hypothetical protein